MPYIPQLSIEGIQEVQQRNLKRIASMQPSGEAGAAVRDAIVALHRYAVTITHVGMYQRHGNTVGGGSLRAAHRMELDGLSGMVYIDPSAKNPITKQKPVIYGVYENERGGEHAFYDRTEKEEGPKVSNMVAGRIKDAMLYVK
jgi:hypothetical protein